MNDNNDNNGNNGNSCKKNTQVTRNKRTLTYDEYFNEIMKNDEGRYDSDTSGELFLSDLKGYLFQSL